YRWSKLQSFARVVGVGLAISALFGSWFLDPYIDFVYGTMPILALGAAGSVAPIIRMANENPNDLLQRGEFYVWMLQPLFEVAAATLMVLLCLRIISLLM